MPDTFPTPETIKKVEAAELQAYDFYNAVITLKLRVKSKSPYVLNTYKQDALKLLEELKTALNDIDLIPAQEYESA